MSSAMRSCDLPSRQMRLDGWLAVASPGGPSFGNIRAGDGPGKKSSTWTPGGGGRMKTTLVRFAARAAALFVLAACADSTSPPGRLPGSIVVTPASLALDDRTDLQLTATVYDQDGVVFDALPAGTQIGWKSSA